MRALEAAAAVVVLVVALAPTLA
eukprot:COSAG01_NODE_38440_length_489_cov_1.543590_1_plen_22_part_01